MIHYFKQFESYFAEVRSFRYYYNNRFKTDFHHDHLLLAFHVEMSIRMFYGEEHYFKYDRLDFNKRYS